MHRTYARCARTAVDACMPVLVWWCMLVCVHQRLLGGAGHPIPAHRACYGKDAHHENSEYFRDRVAGGQSIPGRRQLHAGRPGACVPVSATPQVCMTWTWCPRLGRGLEVRRALQIAVCTLNCVHTSTINTSQAAYVELGQLQPHFTNTWDFSAVPNVSRWLADMASCTPVGASASDSA